MKTILAGVLLMGAGALGLGGKAGMRAGEAGRGFVFIQATQTQPGKREETALKGHTLDVTCLAFSPDGKLLVSASEDTTLIVWDTEKKTARYTLEAHTSPILAVAFSPDGKHIVSGDKGHHLVVWDAEKGEIESLHEQYCEVRGLAFLNDNQHFVSLCGAVLRVWEIGKTPEIGACPSNSELQALVVTGAGEVITGGFKGELTVWDAIEKKALVRHTRSTVTGLPFPDNYIWGLAIRPSGHVLVNDSSGVWDWDRTADRFALISDGVSDLRGVLSDDSYYFGRTRGRKTWFREMSPESATVNLPANMNTEAIAATTKGDLLAYAGGQTDGGKLDPRDRFPVMMTKLSEAKEALAATQTQEAEKIAAQRPANAAATEPKKANAVDKNHAAYDPWE